MAITASKLGSSPLTLDWTNLLGQPEASDEALSTKTWESLKQRFQAGEVGFYDCPIQDELSQASASQKLAEKLVGEDFTDCLVLGIGGSALGPLSLLSALLDRAKSRINLHFQENPDPFDWKRTLSQLDPQTTLVLAITKSGTTFETMAQLLLALEWLGKPRWKSHVVAITDPVKGDLRAFASQEGLQTLDIAPSMGGRFSVFSPVGLLPLALSGLSVSDFLNGAKQVRDYVEKTDHKKNVIFNLAHELIRQYDQRRIHVCMPYSTRLRLFGSWFVQLWGESLGKDGKGFTPLDAVGATDQHSILQLLRDGPDDKVTFFIAVDQVDDPVKIPKAPSAPGMKSYPAFKLLEGHSLQELLEIEYRAIALVLNKQRKPTLTLRVDRLDERTMGALYFAFSVLTAFTGCAWGVNPFDQPGVEEGKIYIRESLSQKTERPEDDENSAVNRLRRGESS